MSATDIASPSAATSASGFDDAQRQALREAATLHSDRVRAAVQVAALEGQLQEPGGVWLGAPRVG